MENFFMKMNLNDRNKFFKCLDPFNEILFEIRTPHIDDEGENIWEFKHSNEFLHTIKEVKASLHKIVKGAVKQYKNELNRCYIYENKVKMGSLKDLITEPKKLTMSDINSKFNK